MYPLRCFLTSHNTNPVTSGPLSLPFSYVLKSFALVASLYTLVYFLFDSSSSSHTFCCKFNTFVVWTVPPVTSWTHVTVSDMGLFPASRIRSSCWASPADLVVTGSLETVSRSPSTLLLRAGPHFSSDLVVFSPWWLWICFSLPSVAWNLEGVCVCVCVCVCSNLHYIPPKCIILLTYNL